MASLRQVLVAVQLQVSAVTSNLSMFNAPISVSVGVGWPPVRTLQSAVKMTPPMALVSVFDRKMSHDSTRWSPAAVAQQIVPATMVSSPSQQILPAGGTCQLALSSAPAAGDAVSIVLLNRSAEASADPGDGSYTASPGGAVVVAARAGDGLATVADALAAAFNATPTLAAVAAATVAGTSVVLTSRSRSASVVSSYTGNGGTVTTELGRRRRDVQISIWAPSVEIRDIVAGVVEPLVAEMEMFRGSSGQFASGLPLADGSSGRILASNDFQINDPVLSDLYRYDFILTIDYPVTVMDNVYAVLAPVLQYQITA